MQISLRPVDSRIVQRAVGKNWFIPGVSSEKPLRGQVRTALKRSIVAEYGFEQNFRPSEEAVSFAYDKLLVGITPPIPALTSKTLSGAVDKAVEIISTKLSEGQSVGAKVNDFGSILWLDTHETKNSLNEYQTKVKETAEKRKAQFWSVLPYQLEKKLGERIFSGINTVRIFTSMIISGLFLSVTNVGLEALGGAFMLKGLHMFIRRQQADYGDQLSQKIAKTKERVISQTQKVCF